VLKLTEDADADYQLTVTDIFVIEQRTRSLR
jgi:hypothetical protein